MPRSLAAVLHLCAGPTSHQWAPTEQQRKRWAGQEPCSSQIHKLNGATVDMLQAKLQIFKCGKTRYTKYTWHRRGFCIEECYWRLTVLAGEPQLGLASGSSFTMADDLLTQRIMAWWRVTHCTHCSDSISHKKKSVPCDFAHRTLFFSPPQLNWANLCFLPFDYLNECFLFPSWLKPSYKQKTGCIIQRKLAVALMAIQTLHCAHRDEPSGLCADTVG